MLGFPSVQECPEGDQGCLKRALSFNGKYEEGDLTISSKALSSRKTLTQAIAAVHLERIIERSKNPISDKFLEFSLIDDSPQVLRTLFEEKLPRVLRRHLGAEDNVPL